MSVIENAENRLKDSINNGTEEDMRYWAAYLDGCRAMEREAGNG